MSRTQILQYAAAVASAVAIVLTDPEVVTFLVEHPGTFLSLLSLPSLATLAGLAARALARRKAVPEHVDDEITKPV